MQVQICFPNTIFWAQEQLPDVKVNVPHQITVNFAPALHHFYTCMPVKWPWMCRDYPGGPVPKAAAASTKNTLAWCSPQRGCHLTPGLVLQQFSERNKSQQVHHALLRKPFHNIRTRNEVSPSTVIQFGEKHTQMGVSAAYTSEVTGRAFSRNMFQCGGMIFNASLPTSPRLTGN